MPFIYVAGSMIVDVKLPVGDDFPFNVWVDSELAESRRSYEKPNIGLWMDIPNEDDADCPYSIPLYELDAYEGGLAVSNDGRAFTFNMNGKFKVKVHKDVKAQVDAGKRPFLTAVSINGQQHPLSEPMVVDFKIQSKKL